MLTEEQAKIVAGQIYDFLARRLDPDEPPHPDTILAAVKSVTNLTVAPPKVEGSVPNARERRNKELESGGGAAFPIPICQSDGVVYDSEEYCAGNAGMTLRDYFASAALNQRKALSFGNWYATDAAREAYEIADAMLAARVAPIPVVTGEVRT